MRGAARAADSPPAHSPSSTPAAAERGSDRAMAVVPDGRTRRGARAAGRRRPPDTRIARSAAPRATARHRAVVDECVQMRIEQRPHRERDGEGRERQPRPAIVEAGIADRERRPASRTGRPAVHRDSASPDPPAEPGWRRPAPASAPRAGRARWTRDRCRSRLHQPRRPPKVNGRTRPVSAAAAGRSRRGGCARGYRCR